MVDRARSGDVKDPEASVTCGISSQKRLCDNAECDGIFCGRLYCFCGAFGIQETFTTGKDKNAFTFLLKASSLIAGQLGECFPLASFSINSSFLICTRGL